MQCLPTRNNKQSHIMLFPLILYLTFF